MTKRHFIAQVAVLSEHGTYAAAGGGSVFNPGDIAERILPNLKGGQLFAYLFRRFGYPSFGWDEDKNLVSYLITTPVQDVFVSITPYMGGDFQQGYDCTELMFGYCIAKEVDDVFNDLLRQGKRDAWEAHPRYKQCMSAFETAIQDLLRPVFVRDVPINCYGRVMDEDCEKLPASVSPYHAAGYPIPSKFFTSGARWEAFTDALITQGNGSIEKGIDAVIKTAATITACQEKEPS